MAAPLYDLFISACSRSGRDDFPTAEAICRKMVRSPPMPQVKL